MNLNYIITTLRAEFPFTVFSTGSFETINKIYNKSPNKMVILISPLPHATILNAIRETLNKTCYNCIGLEIDEKQRIIISLIPSIYNL